MTTALALLVAWTFWGSQGVAPSCHPEVEWVRALPTYNINGVRLEPAAIAFVKECKIVIGPFGWGGCISRFIKPYGDCNYHRDSSYWDYCATITHEAGHLWGLDHPRDASGNGVDDGTIMGTYGPDWDHIPWGCKKPKKFRKCYHLFYHRDGTRKSIPPRVRHKCNLTQM